MKSPHYAVFPSIPETECGLHLSCGDRFLVHNYLLAHPELGVPQYGLSTPSMLGYTALREVDWLPVASEVSV
jgi:hypothetical protein